MNLARTRALAWLPLVIFVAGANGKGCKSCKGAPDVEPDVVDVNDGVQDVASTLQVVSLEPSFGPPDLPVAAVVYGAGFQGGASATVGGLPASKVVVSGSNSLTLTVPGLAIGAHDLVVTNPDGGKATLRRAFTARAAEIAVTEDCRKVTVYFETDVDGLGPQAEDTLRKKAPCIASRTGRVVVAGHADERGTTDYNLGLGQRRAHRVAGALMSAGVARGRIETISYGEEKPAVAGASEAAWSQNRRVEIDAF